MTANDPTTDRCDFIAFQFPISISRHIVEQEVNAMRKGDVVQAMELAALAYRDIQPYFPDWTLTPVDDSRTGVQYYIRMRGDTLSITFRGSNSQKDWRHNLAFWKKTIPYDNTASKIRVHAGFISAYKQPQVRTRIQSFVTDDIHRVQICGHSYGAALAVLCAVDLEYHFPKKDFEVLLFGCPRVGNRAFQQSYNKRVFKTLRVENGNDIVTKIPFALMGYRHVGIKIHIGHPRIWGLISFNQHRPQYYYSSLLTDLLS